MKTEHGYGGDVSEYESRENHQPFQDLNFKGELARIFGIRLGVALCVAIGLDYSGHGWWALAALAIAICSMVGPVLRQTKDRVRFFKEGVLTTVMRIPWKENAIWNQIPWSTILHIDLSNERFQIKTLPTAEGGAQVYTYFGKLEKAESQQLIEDLKSFQQRGDIPAAVRIIS